MAAYGPLEIRNPAAPPVLHRFRGKQIHTNKEFQRSNESLFPKKTLNRFHNPSIVWILPVIGHCYFLQKSVLAIPERLSHSPSTPRFSKPAWARRRESTGEGHSEVATAS